MIRQPRSRRRLGLGLVTLGLSFVPLVGTLGYFGCFVLSPIFALIGIAVGIEGGRAERSRSAESILTSTGRELGVLSAISLGVMLVAIAWNPTCDPLAGLEYFAMGPMISGALGAVCGLWGTQLGSRGWTRWLWGLVPMLACTAVGLWRLYFDPVVYAFDPFFGWFSGPIYDESVGIDQRYRWFRFYNGCAASAALVAWPWLRLRMQSPGDSMIRTARARPRASAVVLALGSIAAVMGGRPTEWGFHSTVDSIHDALGASVRTEHFVIHYAPRSTTALDIEAVAMEHEFAWQRLEAIVGDAPPSPVHSFVFANAKQKRRLFGAGDVEVSMPWRGHVYLTQRGYPHAVLPHELAHTFAGVWGDSLLRISRSGLSLDGGLIEGVAVALAPSTSDGLDPHEQAAVLDALELRPSLASIMGPSFWSASASRAYVTAGSFCAWLLERFGAEKLGRLYGDPGAYSEIYGHDLPALEAQWLAFIRDEVGTKQSDVEAQRQRFKRRAVFRRPCAHRAAALGSEAASARRRGDDDVAIERLEELCAIEPEEPGHRLSLARTRAASGDGAGALAEVERAAAMEDLTDSILASIDQTRGDIHLVAGETEQAAAAYDRALGRSLRERTRRTVQVKHLGTSSGDPTTARLIGEYFAPFETEAPDWVRRLRRLTVALELAERPATATLGHYLTARQLLNASLDDAAIDHARLATEDATTPLPSIELRRAATKAALALYIRAADHGRARRALAGLTVIEGENPSRGRQLEMRRWLARLEHASQWQARPERARLERAD
jgi:tetratricopeptide (TPR) repeat protein